MPFVSSVSVVSPDVEVNMSSLDGMWEVVQSTKTSNGKKKLAMDNNGALFHLIVLAVINLITDGAIVAAQGK